MLGAEGDQQNALEPSVVEEVVEAPDVLAVLVERIAIRIRVERVHVTVAHLHFLLDRIPHSRLQVVVEHGRLGEHGVDLMDDNLRGHFFLELLRSRVTMGQMRMRM